MKTRLLLVLTALALATPSFAQLASPNATGAAIGHIHINTADVDAQTRFWTGVGGQIVQREKLTMVQIPGVYILLRKQDPTGGTNGSVLNHFGLPFRLRRRRSLRRVRRVTATRTEAGAATRPTA